MSKTWKDKTILITGAGSGIGKALAQLLAQQEAKLILTDINADNLRSTCEELKYNLCLSMVADVSKKEDWQALQVQVQASIGYLDVLVNNAGMSSFGYFDELSESLFNKVMDVNFNGVVLGCREMMPLLEQSKRGLIVNVASIFAMITMPMMTPYHASKFAVRGFTEALRQDMAFANKNIDIVCVMPGGIKTNIANYATIEGNRDNNFAAHFNATAKSTPQYAAKVIEKGMRNKTFKILIGADAKFASMLNRIFPVSYHKITNAFMGVNKMIG